MTHSWIGFNLRVQLEDSCVLLRIVAYQNLVLTMKKYYRITTKLLLLSLMIVLCGCTQVEKPDETFIEIQELDDAGEHRYYCRQAIIYPDNSAIISKDGNNDVFIACRISQRSDSTATLIPVSAYKNTQKMTSVELPDSFSASWYGTKASLTTTSALVKDFDNAKVKYHDRVINYNKIHTIHAELLKDPSFASTKPSDIEDVQQADQPQLTTDKSQNVAAADSLHKAKPNQKYSVTGVPIEPDYSSGRTEGELNEFTPANPIQFIDYYFGIFVFVLFIIELAMHWYGSVSHENEEWRYNRLDTYTVLCLILLTIESILEIVIFTANPMVLFQSDMPMFGCLGRVLFFLTMCIGQAMSIRIIRAKLHHIYRTPFMKWSWVLTALSTILTLVALFSLIDVKVVIGDIVPNLGILMWLAIGGIWLLSIVRLVRFIAVSGRAPFAVILFYTLIYPLFIPVAICGLAIGGLAKIAIEKPDNEYSKIENDHDPRYITDALGNTQYVTHLGNGYWMDSQGGMYRQSGKTFSDLNSGTPYH